MHGRMGPQRLILALLLLIPLLGGCSGTGDSVAVAPAGGPPAPPTGNPHKESISSKAEAGVESTVTNRNVNLVPGWNPIGFESQQLTALSANPNIAGMCTWNGSSYVTSNFSTSDVNSGQKARRGFFLFATSATNFTYSGNDDGLGNYVDLQQGYNLVSFTTDANFSGANLTTTVSGNSVPPNSVIFRTFYEIQSDQSYVGVNALGGGTLKPGKAYWVYSLGSVRLNWGPAPDPLILSTTNATTVVGGNIVLTGTIGGAAQNLSVAVGNTGVAAVTGNGTTSPTFTGVSTGTTNFTAEAAGQTVQGNVTVVDGTLQSTLVISPGTALTVNEGDQRQFRAYAQFSTPGGSVVQIDVTNQSLWLVTNTTNQSLGEAIRFDAGAGNFTATRGNAGSVQVGAMFSNASGVAIGNTQVTINRTNPTIIVRPAGSSETNFARVPVGGWSRLFEAVAAYPSGYQKVLTGTDVSWTNTTNPALGSVQFYSTGRAAVTTSTSASNPGQATLTATYTNSLSGLAGGNHTIGLITYMLQNCTAGFGTQLPNDLRVVPGSGSANSGFLRPITVVANFLDLNAAGNNLVMPLFTPPSSNSASQAGALSLYLNPGALFFIPFQNQPSVTSQTVRLLTGAITPVGYTHILRNVTSGIYNQNVLNIRLNYRSAPSLQAVGRLDGPIVGASSAIGGDRDIARTATMSNITLDGATSLFATAGNANLRRGQPTNITAVAQYVGVGGAQEDVTQLVDFIAGSPGNISVGNVTNGIGQVKGRAVNQAPPGGGTGSATVFVNYPRIGGSPTIGVVPLNITLP